MTILIAGVLTNQPVCGRGRSGDGKQTAQTEMAQSTDYTSSLHHIFFFKSLHVFWKRWLHGAKRWRSSALVEERSPLYNITLQWYSNRNRKIKLWREIKTELRLSGKITTYNQCISTTVYEKQDSDSRHEIV